MNRFPCTFLVLFFVLLIPLLVFSQNNRFNSGDNLFAMFYNVENLFDTINSPTKNDDEFTPNSKKLWNYN